MIVKKKSVGSIFSYGFVISSQQSHHFTKTHWEFHSRGFKYEKSTAETSHTLLLSCHANLKDKRGYEKKGTVCFEQTFEEYFQVRQVFQIAWASSLLRGKLAFGWPAFFSVSIADIYFKKGIFIHMNSLCWACLTGTRVVKCTTQRHKRGVLVNAIQECWVFIPTASNQYYTYL